MGDRKEEYLQYVKRQKGKIPFLCFKIVISYIRIKPSSTKVFNWKRCKILRNCEANYVHIIAFMYWAKDREAIVTSS